VSTTLTILLASLLLYFVPIWMLRGRSYLLLNDRVVSKDAVPASIFQSSSVAYSMQMAMLGPFFIWGLTRDNLAPFLNSIAFMFGLLLIWVFRRKLVVFFGNKLGNNDSITVHEFISSQFGHSATVRNVASAITLFGQIGVIVAEILGLLAIVTALFPNYADAATWILIGVFMLMIGYTALGGNEGAMLTSSLQLRIIYISLSVFIGAFLLAPKQTNGIGFSSATLIGLAFIALLLAGAQWASRPIADKRKALALDRILAIIACLCLVAIAYYCLQTYFSGSQPQSFQQPWINNSVPIVGLLSMVLLPLCFQINDLANWQKIASMRLTPSSQGLSKSLLGYAVEAPAIQVLCILLGMVVLIDPLFQDILSFEQFARTLFQSDVFHYQVASAAFVIATFAIALSTIDSAFSASICTFLCDINRRAVDDTDQKRTAKSIAVLTAAFFVAVIFVANAGHFFSFGSDHFIGMLMAFYGAQISFLVIVLSGFIAGKEGGRDNLPSWVGVATLLGGTIASVSCTVAGLASGDISWSWYAVLASLGTSSGIFFFGKYLYRS